MESPNLTEENIAKIGQLFPECLTEKRDEFGKTVRAIDFDVLRDYLSDTPIAEDDDSRYMLTWPGKRDARQLAYQSITSTLRPCPEESVDFDTTENLYIEGDNLEVLKLLRETYLGKFKMIYIDPPYNTGKDFIYPDNYSQNQNEYIESTNQRDEDGNRLVRNTETNGKFHTDWLNMMYPRLLLARDILSKDGIIFVSIDDNEIDNLKKIMDDVFGEENFIFQIILLCNPKGRSQDKYIATCHEYLVGYSKNMLNKGDLNILKNEDEIVQNYKLHDERGRYRILELRNTHREFGKHNRQNLYYPFYVSSSGRVSLEKKPGFDPIFPDWDDGFEGCWTWGLEKSQAQLDEIVARKVDNKWKIYRKNYALKEDGESSKQIKSIWTEKEFHTEKGQIIFNDLFETKEKIFPSPKAVDTIKQLLLMGHTTNEFILDFFSGSSTTAHAVMQLNAEDCGNRKFVMVQLPEVCDEKSEAYKAGYKTICDIGKERIRRAGGKIKQENPLSDVDIGFRVLKTASSNLKDVFYTPSETKQTNIEGYVDNIKSDRKSFDLLFQVMLEFGITLDVPITTKNVKGLTIYQVAGNSLSACFDKGVDEDIIQEMAKDKPLYAAFRDVSYREDQTKINVEQIFKQLSPNTKIYAV